MSIRSITKYLSYGFLGIVAFVSLLIALVFSPIGVKVLVSIANDVEGVQLDNVKGSFYSQVSVGKLRFTNPQVNIIADALKLDISVDCLFAGEACVDELSARRFVVTLIENDIQSAPAEPTTQYIELPLAAYLKKFSIDQISIFTKSIETQHLSSQTTLFASLSKVKADLFMHQNLVLNDLSINDIQVILPQVAKDEANTAQVTSNAGEHWIDLLKNTQYTPIELPRVFIPINAQIKNIAVGNVCIKQSQGLLVPANDVFCTQQSQLNATIQKQKINLNFSTKPQKQMLASINASVKVNVEEAFSHDINFQVSPNVALTSAQALPLRLTLVGDTSGSHAKLLTPRTTASIVDLNAKVDVSKADLPLSIALLASAYQPVLGAWLPHLAIPVSKLSASVDGNTQLYKFTVLANIDSEQASEINVNGSASLLNKNITIDDINTSGDIGNLNAKLNAKLMQFEGVDGLSITSNFGFKKLQLQPIVAAIDSQLNGNISAAVNITSTQLWGNLNCKNVQGMLQGYKLSVLCDAAISKAGVVNLQALSVKQGNNTVSGKGKFILPSALNASQIGALANPNEKWLYDTKSDLTFTISAKDVSSLLEGARGEIVGDIKISGALDKPRILANANISKLDVLAVKIQQAQINATLDIANDWQTDITLAANEIWQETMLAEQVNAKIKGNLSAHNITLSLTHPQYSLNQEFSGEAVVKNDTWRWLGRWENGSVESAFDRFTLNQATTIRANPSRINIQPHCWLSSQMTTSQLLTPDTLANNRNKALCIEQLQYTPELTVVSAKLAYNLKAPLLHLFPEIIKVGTSLPFTSDINLNYSDAKGIQLDAQTLMTQANITSSKHNIELVAVVVNSSLQDQELQTNVFAGTKATGAIGLSSVLMLNPQNRSHKGQLRIDNFGLSPLQRFIPNIEKLNGMLAGNILFDGPLVEPNLNGELNIMDVELLADNYPYPVTNFNQTITIVNKQANIQGELELGAGMADYWGTLRLFDEDQLFNFVGEIKGAGMQLAFADNELLASPNLKIALDPNNFSLKGEVTVPNAQFKLEKLPQSAKSASSDTLIIGQEAKPPALPIGLDIDVRIIVDPSKLKRVTVNALDLKASLGGDLRVQVKQTQNPATQEFSPLETYVYGEVNILSGSYEAYGQNLLIRKGSIFFSGAPSLPQFDITAIRNPLNTSDNVEAGVRISGNPAVPKVELFSQPSMIQARQLSYLLRGTDLSGGANDSQNIMLVNMLVGFGVGNSENGVNRLGKSLGFDSLSMQTAGQGDSTQLQVTGRISDNIQISYGVGLFDQATEVILRYQLLPKMYVEATTGATSAVDLFYEWSRGK